MKAQINPEIIAKITNYVYENYRDYKNKNLIITEHDNCFRILKHKDGSPLILGKTVIS
jgi:hypothetical protein